MIDRLLSGHSSERREAPNDDCGREKNCRNCGHAPHTQRSLGRRRERGHGERAGFQFFFQLFQLDLQIRHVLEAPRRVLAQAAGDDAHKLSRNIAAEFAGGLRIVAQNR